jgi:P27 family predicted phage terminase small subunit
MSCEEPAAWNRPRKGRVPSCSVGPSTAGSCGVTGDVTPGTTSKRVSPSSTCDGSTIIARAAGASNTSHGDSGEVRDDGDGDPQIAGGGGVAITNRDVVTSLVQLCVRARKFRREMTGRSNGSTRTDPHVAEPEGASRQPQQAAVVRYAERRPGRPPPPTWLAKEARAEWDRILPELHRRGVVGLLDRAVLTMYCEAWSRWVQAARSVSELVVRGRTSGARDTVVKAPAWTVYRHAADHCLALAKESGLSPAARLRMQLPELPDHDPELDALLRPVRPGDGLDWGGRSARIPSKVHP